MSAWGSDGCPSERVDPGAGTDELAIAALRGVVGAMAGVERGRHEPEEAPSAPAALRRGGSDDDDHEPGGDRPPGFHMGAGRAPRPVRQAAARGPGVLAPRAR